MDIKVLGLEELIRWCVVGVTNDFANTIGRGEPRER